MRHWLLVLAACGDHASKLDELKPPSKPLAIPAPTNLDAAAIDAWVGAEVNRRGITGAAVVVARDGKIVLARGYGPNITADTPFAIGSLTKQLVCAAAYQLAERGQLSMDDPVAKYFPQLTRAADITLADLGGHLSGYRDYYPMDYVDARMTKPITADDLITRYAKMPLDFEPRTRRSYSNTGFTILGRVLEKASGKRYAQVLDELVFKPFGMLASTAPSSVATSGHVAFLLDPVELAPQEAPDWLFGAGDVWASANDVAKWDLGFTKLSPDVQRALSTPRTLANGRTTGYSCGLGVRQTSGLVVLAHTGWVGGFHTHNAIIPLVHGGVVLLTNDEHADATPIFDKLISLVTDVEAFVPKIEGPSPADVVRDLVHQLQAGKIDRSQLADDANAYFDDARVAASAATLRALGEPTITLSSRRERGGMELAEFTLEFPTRTVEASLFRSPDGKVHEFMLR